MFCEKSSNLTSQREVRGRIFFLLRVRCRIRAFGSFTKRLDLLGFCSCKRHSAMLGSAMLTSYTRRVLHCCSVTQYMHKSSTHCVRLGCSVNDPAITIIAISVTATSHITGARVRVLFNTVPC